MKKILLLILSVSILSAGWVNGKQYRTLVKSDKYLSKMGRIHPEFKKWRDDVLGLTLRESSIGKTMIGDREGDKFYYLHMGKKVFISKTYYKKNRVKYKNSKDTYYVYWKSYKKKVRIIKAALKPLNESSIGLLHIQIPTFKRVVKDNMLTKYYSYLDDDMKIVNLLLTDDEVSIEITLYYLEGNYREAIYKGLKEPKIAAIGRHNGGWYNVSYYNKVQDDAKWCIDAIIEDRWNIGY